MKPILFGAWIFLFPLPASGQAGSIPARVVGDGVNLRTGPSRSAEILGQLPRDTEVEVTLTDGEWSAIIPPEGTGGWIARDYLQEGIVTGNRVNVRAGPSVAYAILLTLDEGSRVEVLEEREGWAKISLPGSFRLWLNSRYLSTGSGSPPAGREETAVRPPDSRSREEPARPAAPRPPLSAASPPPAPRPSPPGASGFPAAAVPPAGELRSYTGVVRELEQPFSLGGREYGYALAADRRGERTTAFLTGETVDLSGYRFRPVRIWAQTVEVRPGRPALLEVKGAGFLW